MAEKHTKKGRTKAAKTWRTVGALLFVIFAFLLLAAVTVGFRTVKVIGEEYQSASELKSCLKGFAVSVKNSDIDTAQGQLYEIQSLSGELREGLNASEIQLAMKVPYVRTQCDSALTLLDVLDEGCTEVLQPMLTLMSAQPLSTVKTDSTAAANYLTFAENVLPEARSLLDRVQGLDLSLLDRGGSISALLDTASAACDAVGDDASDLLDAASKLLAAYPVSSLRAGDGFNVIAINAYLDFAEEYMPEIKDIMGRFETQLPESFTQNETYAKYYEEAKSLITLYDENSDIIELVRLVLGNGEDRYYLVPALNTAELRSVGGFPGAAGSIEIRDGILTIGQFKGVHNMIPGYFPASVSLPYSEIALFNSPLSIPQLSQDACSSPDFSWAATLWAASHEENLGDHVDGVIAVTPVIIQRILNLTGPISLSDGTVLDGTNATKTIQHDIYFQYFTAYSYVDYANAQSDNLFSETASQAMSSLLGSFSLSHIPDYIQIGRESLEDRTIQIWMNDENEQSIVHSLGWTGEPDAVEGQAEVGVYIDFTMSSKMGWFVELNARIGSPVINADGSKTYTVTVSVGDTITTSEIYNAGDYILGGSGGNINYNLYLFAPEGATISNIRQEMGYYVDYEYRGLNVTYVKDQYVTPGNRTVVTYDLTTAPGSDLPLVIRTTNTLQAYHTS